MKTVYSDTTYLREENNSKGGELLDPNQETISRLRLRSFLNKS